VPPVCKGHSYDISTKCIQDIVFNAQSALDARIYLSATFSSSTAPQYWICIFGL
jgi:hypothetical protein